MLQWFYFNPPPIFYSAYHGFKKENAYSLFNVTLVHQRGGTRSSVSCFCAIHFTPSTMRAHTTTHARNYIDETAETERDECFPAPSCVVSSSDDFVAMFIGVKKTVCK